MSELKELINELVKFRNERDWEQFHNPKDLAIALSIEAGELLELFLWKDHEHADKNKVKDELADILIYSIFIAEKYGWKIEDVIKGKMKKNEINYPVNKSKGNAKKYNEL